MFCDLSKSRLLSLIDRQYHPPADTIVLYCTLTSVDEIRPRRCVTALLAVKECREAVVNGPASDKDRGQTDSRPRPVTYRTCQKDRLLYC